MIIEGIIAALVAGAIQLAQAIAEAIQQCYVPSLDAIC